MQTPHHLNNRYEILRELGDGGFGKTFLVRDHQMPSSRQCVLKQLKPLQGNPEIYTLVKERFQREAAILEHLGDHPQVPRLHAYFCENDLFYLVEEYIEGDTLTQRLQRQGPWLVTNAAQYGFEQSFPKNNTQGVSYEPWHWRYVGSARSAQIFTQARSQ
jgi:serine/threonine protein kinase